MGWNQFDVDGAGISFVSAVVDTLWYIDGHHQVFEKQGLKIPDIFSQFIGYNVPEASKHRKRSAMNMSQCTIHSHSASLFGHLQGLYWTHPKFAILKQATEELARCLLQYGDYLQSQNKHLKQSHASSTSIHQLSDSLSVNIIKKSLLRFQCYSEFCNTLQKM